MTRQTTPHRVRPFVGVDGEGGTIDGRHVYLLLRAGDDALETGDPLTSFQCLEFLSRLPPFREYVSYFFDYDVTMMLRGLPAERVVRLLDRESRIWSDEFPPWPVDIGPYQIDYLPHKEFRVRKGKIDPWVIVNDVGSFFQCKFLVALEKWGIGTDANRADIAKGKDSRSGFGVMTEETRFYNQLEVELLEDLMTAFRGVCTDVGYTPRLWQGPGHLAKAMFAKHKIPRTKDLPMLPDGLWDMAQAAYYGGRFETSAVGPVTGPVWQYDINSAYPYAATMLPCLQHGRWIRTKNPRGLYVAFLRFQHPGHRLWHNFPVRRKDGSIHYPQHGRGWYWSPEIRSALSSGATVRIRDAWQYEPTCTCHPFNWVPGVYAQRVDLGKTGKGIILKLALNSLYGVCAQSIGQAPYGNPILAGLFTAHTRAQLAEHLSDHTVMVATDALFTTQPLPLESSTRLGGWDVVEHAEGMFIIQPGLYFAGNQKPKTRGVPLGKIFEREQEFRDAWAESPWTTVRHLNRDDVHDVPAVDVPLSSFVSLRLAHARGKPETAGQWVDEIRTVSFDWRTKRRPWKVRRDPCGLRTFPYVGAPDVVTVPYSRYIGGNLLRNMARLDSEDAPDWAEGLT